MNKIFRRLFAGVLALFLAFSPLFSITGLAFTPINPGNPIEPGDPITPGDPIEPGDPIIPGDSPETGDPPESGDQPNPGVLSLPLHR